MDIKIISAYDHPQEISELFSEYTDMLIAGDSSFKQYLKIQHYDYEIKNLESKYCLLYTSTEAQRWGTREFPEP